MTIETTMTTQQVAARFYELAKKEAWFEIQDKLFAENVKSNEPPSSPLLQNAEGKAAVRSKGEAWVKRITAANKLQTTEPIVGENHFAVGREVDIDVEGIGRIQINQIMLYEVKNGEIISEQFFY
ncbi:MAG: nuclear transport factor 2 family protein [Chitinophagaceae bacterium]|nr:MAG: nuclear transport factor 2 family protein [Chitinophagaceae bacterium]